MSNEQREARMVYSMLTFGNARSCLTEHELSMAEEDVNPAKKFSTEWNPEADITYAHPRVGFCEAAATSACGNVLTRHAERSQTPLPHVSDAAR